jgi:ATP-binding cassette subfamily B protein
VVLKDGRIVEEGTHAQLIQRRGYYWSLVQRQTHGLLPLTDPAAPAPPLSPAA